MLYTRCSNSDDYRSSAYRGTVTSKEDYSLNEIKRDVRARNKNARKYITEYFNRFGKMPKFMEIERVQLMARGPRADHAARDFRGARRAYDQSLPHKYATHFDVYVRRDTHAEYVLQYCLEHNLTPGQYNLIRRMETRQMWMNVEIAKELRKHGVQSLGKPGGRTEYRGV